MRLDDRRLPSDFARAVVQNNDMVILSDGLPKRTFCYVADAIVGYLKAMSYGEFEYFNIGIDKPEISVKKLAEIFMEKGQRIMGYTGNIQYSTSGDREYLTHNPARRCPNIDKARRLLRYNPLIEVEEGVGRFLEFFKISKGVL